MTELLLWSPSYGRNMVRKNNKYIIMALIGGAVLMFALFFILGNKKEYLIAFDSSGGSLVESQTITEGGTVVKPTDPTKENYSFIRWEYQNREY